MQRKEIAFDGQKVTVEYRHQVISDMLDFLFLDLEDDQAAESTETFVIAKNDGESGWSLLRNKESLFSGDSLAGLGVVLMGEALFHLIRENHNGLAIHAGLVSNDHSTTLIPGASGSGKSSVTTWMLCNGMRYHTDELVTINLDTQHAKPFTRPLNIKTAGLEAVKGIIDLDAIDQQIRTSSAVTMIPHRLVNADFRKETPLITRIVFPKYVADSEPKIIRLPGAEAGLELMRCNVIARNLPNHGFGEVIKLVRNIPAYRMHYQHFDDLPHLISAIH